MKNISTLISLLGGTGEIARRLDVKPSAISNWKKQNKIPKKKQIAISNLSKELKINIDEFLYSDDLKNFKLSILLIISGGIASYKSLEIIRLLKQKNIELKDHMEDEEYLNILHKNLKELNKNKYDFVFYVAGVDIHFGDRLGKLKITDEGINKRDQIVIENFYSKNTPLCGVLGGGYNKSFEKLIELHSMLHKNCANYFS